MPAAALAGVSALVLFLSAMGLFSLMSISVSRRRREIGVRMALGANPRHVLARIVARAMVLMGSGAAAGSGVVLLFVSLGGGPTGRPADDVVSFAAWIAVTSAVMLGAGLVACVEPARRALRSIPSTHSGTLEEPSSVSDETMADASLQAGVGAIVQCCIVIRPSIEPEDAPVARSIVRRTVSVPPAPAKRPVPPVIVNVSTMFDNVPPAGTPKPVNVENS